MTLLALLLAVTVQMTPTCKFTTNIREAEGFGRSACQSGLLSQVSLLGTNSNLNIEVVATYSDDMKGRQIVGTGREITAIKAATAEWNYFRERLGAESFQIKFRDAKERDVCWFEWDHSKSDDTPTVSRCVILVGDKEEEK